MSVGTMSLWDQRNFICYCSVLKNNGISSKKLFKAIFMWFFLQNYFEEMTYDVCHFFRARASSMIMKKKRTRKTKAQHWSQLVPQPLSLHTEVDREQLQQGSSCSRWSLVRGFSVFSVQAHECSKVKMDCFIRLGDCVQKNYSDYLLCD